METKLFKIKEVKKFFNILSQLGRTVDVKYSGKCAKQIFVERTLDKWFKNKSIELFCENKNNEVGYKRFLTITSITYALAWTDDISVYVFDYGNPEKMFDEITLNHNKCLYLEGIWKEDTTDFMDLMEVFRTDNLNIRSFVAKVYDFNLQTSEDSDMELCKTEITVDARTHREAHKKFEQLQKESKGKIMIYEYPDKQ